MKSVREILEQGGYSCVICSGEKTYASGDRGIKPLLRWIREGINVRGGAAADLIVGKAAALLYVKLGISSLYAAVLSEQGEKILQEHGIVYTYGEKVPYIINRAGNGMCPMEQTVREISDPEDAVGALEAKLSELAGGHSSSTCLSEK